MEKVKTSLLVGLFIFFFWKIYLVGRSKYVPVYFVRNCPACIVMMFPAAVSQYHFQVSNPWREDTIIYIFTLRKSIARSINTPSFTKMTSLFEASLSISWLNSTSLSDKINWGDIAKIKLLISWMAMIGKI